MNIVDLEKKKIVMYGDERYVRDFLYIFDQIKPIYNVDDEENGFAVSWHQLKREKRDDIFVIVCKYECENAVDNLESIGFKKEIHFCKADKLFSQLDFPIKEISLSRPVYVWGTGDIGHNFFHNYIERNPDINIEGCIDNDSNRQGKRFFGRKIKSPDEILKQEENPFVIIASDKYYWEIKKILQTYGKIEKKDFVSYMEINQIASSMMWKTVYDTPRLNYVCRKAFEVLLIKSGGYCTTCVGSVGQIQWNIPLYYAEIDVVWHSNVMKVMRLSVVNGTYTFCDSQRCHLLEKCDRQEINLDDIHNTLFHLPKSRIDNISAKSTNPINTVFNIEHYKIVEEDGPRVLECGWDKTCNLHCSSCRDEVWAADKEKKEELNNFSQRVKKEIILPYVDRLNVAGHGEAFASDIYKSLLFDRELAACVKVLGILSNGMLLTKENCDKILSIWSKVNILISMDGATMDTAEKLRRGLDFEKWKHNMEYVANLRKEGKIKTFSFNFVVQRDNYLEMIEFAKMCLDLHADHIRFSKLGNWGTYTEKEFEEISMFDRFGKMKPELRRITENEVFNRKEIHLFEWLDWEERN